MADLRALGLVRDPCWTWLRRLATVAEGAPAYRVITGLEAWFAARGRAGEREPAALADDGWRPGSAFFPTASFFIWFAGPLLGWSAVPSRGRRSSPALIAVTMSYVVMPRLSPLAEAAARAADPAKDLRR